MAPGIRYAPVVYGEHNNMIVLWFHYDTEADAQKCAEEYVKAGLGRHATTVRVFVPQFIH